MACLVLGSPVAFFLRRSLQQSRLRAAPKAQVHCLALESSPFDRLYTVRNAGQGGNCNRKFAKFPARPYNNAYFDSLRLAIFLRQVNYHIRVTMGRWARLKTAILAFAIAFLHACASVQQISPQSVEDKVARIKLGVTTMNEVENVFGTQHGGENRRWFYNLSDTAMELAQQKTGKLSGVFPVAPQTVATNTRAMITIGFGEDGKVTAFEVSRFFEPPFKNDYWYRVKSGAPKVLEFVRSAGEFNDFHVAGGEKSAGMFALEDPASNARIIVSLENDTLHITSQNPHDRLTTEYRVFTKRERAFINKVSTADFVR